MITCMDYGCCTAVAARRAVAVIRCWALTAAAAARTACGHCGRSADGTLGLCLRVCTGCNTARFCSAECQRHAWSSHKVVCRAIAATAIAATSGDNGAPEVPCCLLTVSVSAALLQCALLPAALQVQLLAVGHPAVHRRFNTCPICIWRQGVAVAVPATTHAHAHYTRALGGLCAPGCARYRLLLRQLPHATG